MRRRLILGFGYFLVVLQALFFVVIYQEWPLEGPPEPLVIVKPEPESEPGTISLDRYLPLPEVKKWRAAEMEREQSNREKMLVYGIGLGVGPMGTVLLLGAFKRVTA